MLIQVAKKLPLVSVVIATRNSDKTLYDCLSSLKKQSYTNYELLILDANSIDSTLKIAKSFDGKIYTNPLKTAEAGKALGLKKAKGEYILLLDSDNMLTSQNYLEDSINLLLANNKIVGVEPWAFTYRNKSGYIERYCALIGANDPYAWFTKHLDKINYLDHSWPHPELVIKDKKNFLLLKLTHKKTIPTIGANGTIFKTDFLNKYQQGDYLFDIDILNRAIQNHSVVFAKIKQGIIHTYCESSLTKFIKKQSRRISDFYIYQPLRKTNWETSPSSSNNLLFLLYSFTLAGPLLTALKGYLNKPDFAWFFHPIACIVTSTIYIYFSLKHEIFKS